MSVEEVMVVVSVCMTTHHYWLCSSLSLCCQVKLYHTNVLQQSFVCNRDHFKCYVFQMRFFDETCSCCSINCESNPYYSVHASAVCPTHLKANCVSMYLQSCVTSFYVLCCESYYLVIVYRSLMSRDMRL